MRFFTCCLNFYCLLILFLLGNLLDFFLTHSYKLIKKFFLFVLENTELFTMFLSNILNILLVRSKSHQITTKTILQCQYFLQLFLFKLILYFLQDFFKSSFFIFNVMIFIFLRFIFLVFLPIFTFCLLLNLLRGLPFNYYIHSSWNHP